MRYILNIVLLFLCFSESSFALFELPKLPYKEDALEPYISKETLHYHYGKHHKGYLDQLNELIRGTPFEKNSLEDIIKISTGKIFNNAAQVYNHTFYWNCMSPKKVSNTPHGEISKLINKTFGSFLEFKKKFTANALELFGSGWVWLLKNGDKLIIKKTANAGCPIKPAKNKPSKKPLLVLDVWEHAYYLDYKNERRKYVENWWNLVNWNFVNSNLKE